MILSAPRPRRMSASSAVAVAITRALAAASNGTSAVPTPPVAPTTRAVSPGRTLAVAISARAVSPVVASAAACSTESPAGRRARNRLAEYVVTRAERRDTGAHLGDSAGEVVTGYVGKLQRHEVAEFAAGQPYISGIDRGRGDPHLELSRPWSRHRHVGHRVLLWRPVARRDNRLHASSPKRTTWSSSV